MINSNDTVILGIDIQDKLVKMIDNSSCDYCYDVKDNAVKLLSAGGVLNVETVLTEQYPKGLGETIGEIKDIEKYNHFKVFEKTGFSAVFEKDINDLFDKYRNDGIKNVLIFGIETHICVYQTVLDLIKKGFSVFVVSDCCASRNIFNHNCALELMKQHGAKITSLEIVLFEFLKSSKHPDFKEIQGLIK